MGYTEYILAYLLIGSFFVIYTISIIVAVLVDRSDVTTGKIVIFVCSTIGLLFWPIILFMLIFFKIKGVK